MSSNPESTQEILSDMHVLNSLKKQSFVSPVSAGEKSELVVKEEDSMVFQTPVAANNSDNTDRLMQMMDKKFSKFEDIITQIATNMGQLQGEVNQMKGKLADAKLL